MELEISGGYLSVWDDEDGIVDEEDPVDEEDGVNGEGGVDDEDGDDEDDVVVQVAVVLVEAEGILVLVLAEFFGV